MSLGATLAGGCAGVGAPPVAWVEFHGGDRDAPQRVQRIADRVVGEQRVTVRVLGSDDLAAYAWRDGSIFVTRGLVNHLTDDELAAAIAHEMGHLLDDGRLTPPVRLAGQPLSGDAEHRADVTAVALLSARGLPASAMFTMLTKLRSVPHLSPAQRDQIDARITALRSQFE